MASALKTAIKSGSRDAVIRVLAYYAALSSWHVQHRNNDDYANMRTDEIIEGKLYGNLAEITDPNRYGNSLNPVLNDLVTQIYGWDAANLTNRYLMQMNEGDFSHDGFWVPSSYTIDPKPAPTIESILGAGGYWNKSGALVDNQGVIHDEFDGRGDYEVSHGAEIVGYFDDGTAAVRTADGDYPVYSIPKQPPIDTAFETVKATVSNIETQKYGLIDSMGGKGISKVAYHTNKALMYGGGITGVVFTGKDIYDDWNSYSGENFIKAAITDVIPSVYGVAGGVIGGVFVPYIGGAFGGVYGSVVGADKRMDLRRLWRLK